MGSPYSRKNAREENHGKEDSSRFFQSKKPTVYQEENCPIQEKCRSCLYVNKDYEVFASKKYKKAMEDLKEKISLDNVKCIDLELSPRTKAYRTSVKLAIREKKNPRTPGRNLIDIGLFMPGSHDLVGLDTCYVQHEEINALVSSIRTLLQESDLTAYDEKTHTGSLRYLLARVSHKNKELSLTFVATSRSCYTKLRELVKKLKLRHNITNAFLNINSEQTNRITGTVSKKLLGGDYLRESLCHFDLRVSPLSFFQVNPFTAAKIYERVEQLVGKTSRTGTVAWDLYCGVGIFSLILMRQGYQVLGIEENPFALKDAIENAQRNFPSQISQFKEASVENFIESQSNINSSVKEPEVIIINPSRSGLHKTVCEKLISYKKQKKSHKIIYVSCEASSMTRDLALLCEGGYTLRQLECFDMFPHTQKLEWLSVLT